MAITEDQLAGFMKALVENESFIDEWLDDPDSTIEAYDLDLEDQLKSRLTELSREELEGMKNLSESDSLELGEAVDIMSKSCTVAGTVNLLEK